MGAQADTVFQMNFKVGNDLHNIYASNGQEAVELVEFFTETLLPKLVSATQLATASSHVAAGVPLAPPAQQPAPAGPVTPPPVAPAPPQAGAPTHMCAHGQPMKLVPGGVSKASGKPYNAFWACAQPRGQQCDTKVAA